MPEIPPTTMRIDPELKRKAKPILDELGLTFTGAVTMFLKALIREGGLPFDVAHVLDRDIKEGTEDE